MYARVKKIDIQKDKRLICVSDIHGSLDLFLRLLKKINYSDEDILVLLGDFHAKGKQCLETFKYVKKLCYNPNVHLLLGNCDRFYDEYLDESDKEWLDTLPHIIESEDFIFVHGGLTSDNLAGQEPRACMKNNAFAEQGLSFKKYVITGHWPCANYTHEIPCNNPIVNHKSKIIAIDGGNVLRSDGQLNAFIIKDGVFSFDYADDLPKTLINKTQAESGGNLHITWNDRFVDIIEKGEELSLCRHIETGREVLALNEHIWEDEGKLCAFLATDYFLPVEKGEEVSVVIRFSDRIYAKKNGVCGWVML